MNRLIRAALETRVLANLIAAALVLAGLATLATTTVRLFPDIQLEAVSITVPYPGATPEDVEEGVVEPIERQLEGLEGVRKITSLAAENVANVVVSLESGEDVDRIIADVETELDRITVFPRRAEEARVTELEADELTIQFVFRGPDRLALKRAAEDMRERLIDTDAISDVRVEAVPEDLIDVQVEEATLRRYGLTLQGLARRIGAESLDLSGGEIEGDARRLIVRTLGERERGAGYERLVVATGENGAEVRLGDLATVEDGLAEGPLQGTFDAAPAAVVSVFRVGDEQVFESVETANRVFEGEVLPGLPEGMEAEVWRDESSSLRSRIDLLLENAGLGLALVFALLLLFLDLRVAFWVAAGVGVAFVGSFALLGAAGITINQITLFGFILAIGIVVDDAIVVGENIYVRRRSGAGEEEAARDGVTEVSRPVLFAIVTTIVAFVPLLLIPGTYGQFMGPIAAVVIFVLVVSLVEAFFVLPRHLAHLSDDEPRWYSPRRFTAPLRERTGGALERFADGPLRRAVGAAIAHPLLTIATFIGVFAASLLLLTSGTVKFVFFPKIEGNYVTATVELSERASEAETLRAMERLERAARRAAERFSPAEGSDLDSVLRGVLAVRGAKVGGREPNKSTSGEPVSNLGILTARIEDADVRAFAAPAFESAWREEAGEIPGAQRLVFSSDVVSSGAPVQLNVRSRDEARAREVVGALREELEAIPGVLDIRDDRFRTSDEVQVRARPEARTFGLSLQDLAVAVRASFYGAEATRIQRGREEVEVRVRLPRDRRDSLAAVRGRRIATAEGGWIPLEEVADVTIGDAPASIRRIDGLRVVTLTADVDTAVTTGGAVTGEMLGEHWAALSADFPEVSVGVGGDQEEQGRAGPSIARNFGLALFAIYALLAVVFNSYTRPLVVMGVVPFGFVGALVGHALLGLNLTILSLFGVIGLSGVVLNDGILLMQFIRAELDSGRERVDAILEAALARFRPILLTSLTTFLGVTPIILETSVQAKFLIPTAVSLGVGILFATVILLFLLPALARVRLDVLGARA